MKLKRLGRTDLLVSELGFGCFGIGGNSSGNSYGPTEDETSVAAIHAALELGCNFFDTADVYGYGHSEVMLSRALRDASKQQDTVVATKGGARFGAGPVVMDFSRGHLVAAVDGSLTRLRRECLDLYQLHNPSLALIRSGEVFEVLDDLVAAGKIRHYGVSVHTAEEGTLCLEYPAVATLQVPFSLITLLQPQGPWMELFDVALSRGIGIIAREPLAAGFLSGKHTRATSYGHGDLRGLWPRDRQHLYVALADSVRHLEQPGISLAQVALRFVMDEPAVSTTIVGIKTPAQAYENFGAADIPSFAELEATARLRQKEQRGMHQETDSRRPTMRAD